MPTAALSTDTEEDVVRREGASPGLRQRLRTATAGAHARLDSQLGALALDRLPDYRRFLETSAAALLPLEMALDRSGVTRLFPDWPARSRRDAILADLARVDGQATPLPVPEPFDLGGVLGAMYVLEGSRLGAKMLSAIVTKSPDPRVAGATAYLRHGEGQHLWRSFLAALETHAAALPDDRSAIRGARLAFDLFAEAAARICQPEKGPALV
jgi:heme oxygenase